MKKFLLLLFLFSPLFCFAQFSDDYNYYIYIPRGESAGSCSSGIHYVHFDSDEKLYCSTISKSTLKTKYNDGVIDEYAINKSHNYKYDSYTSTYKYEVYVAKTYTQRTFGPGNFLMYDPYGSGAPVMDHSGYRYYAFSYDRTEMITWTTGKNDDTPKGKKYYKLI
ncbi:MAG: hypothetical protein IKA41_05415, partial [Bacteroidaceae bacterium]|nr:hypothetical protein [Bacteroidaceae bacterium]